MIAFVLVQLKECDETKVLDKLKELKSVKEAFILFGEWDLIIKVELASPEEFGRFMIEDVRTIEEIKLTSSMIVASN